MIKIKLSGIYKIEHVKSNKCYIGMSVDIIGRWQSHYTQIMMKKHSSKKLEELFLNTNVEEWNFSVLEKVSKTKFKLESGYKGKVLDAAFRKLLIEREKYWMGMHSLNLSLNNRDSQFN